MAPVLRHPFAPCGPIVRSVDAVCPARSARTRRRVVTKGQTRESGIEIDLRVVTDGLGPNDVELPRARCRDAESRATLAIGHRHRDRAFIGPEIGQLDRRIGQAALVIENMDRKHSRSAERIGIAVGNDLQLEPERSSGKCLVSHSRLPNLDQSLGATAVAFAARLTGRPTGLAGRKDQDKTFLARIVIEAYRGEFGRGMIGLHGNYMKSRRAASGREIEPSAAAQLPFQVARGAEIKIVEGNDPIVVVPAVAKFAVAHQEGEEQRRAGVNLEPDRLNPKIVSGGGDPDQQQGECGNSDFHATSFPRSENVCRSLMLRPVDRIGRINAAPDNRRSHQRGRAFATVGLLLLLVALPSPAIAHGGTGLAGGFAAGFTHPLSGFDHMLAMVAVGIWGAFLGRPLLYALPMLFPAAMAIGGGIGMAGIPLPPVELGIAVSVLALGTLIFLAMRLPVLVACAIVGMFALFHGYAHGIELPSAADPIGYSAGFVLCTGLLHLAGIALGTLRAWPVGTWALRGAGGAMALIGIWFTLMALPL